MHKYRIAHRMSPKLHWFTQIEKCYKNVLKLQPLHNYHFSYWCWGSGLGCAMSTHPPVGSSVISVLQLFIRSSTCVMTDSKYNWRAQILISLRDFVMGLHRQCLKDTEVCYPTTSTEAEWYSRLHYVHDQEEMLWGVQHCPCLITTDIYCWMLLCLSTDRKPLPAFLSYTPCSPLKWNLSIKSMSA